MFQRNKEFYFLLLAFLLLTIKYGLQYVSPFTNTDGPWTLSSAISFLNGNYNASIFSHDYMGEVFTVHVFQVICAPFFYFFGLSTNSLFAFILVLIFSKSLGDQLVYYLSFYHTNSSYFFALSNNDIIYSGRIAISNW